MDLRKIFVILTAGLLALAASGATGAEKLVGQVKSKLASAPSVDVVFTINGGEGPVQGSATMAKDRYFLSTPVLTVWYDGRTQWTYLKSTDEVSITEPTADELIAANPFAILSAASDNYTLRQLTDSQGRKRVELTPKSKMSGISKIVLFIDPATYYPHAIVVNFDDGRSVDVVIDKVTAGTTKPVSAFRYDKNRFPATEIIDLR